MQPTKSNVSWISGPLSDSIFILLPAFLVSFCVIVFPQAFASGQSTPDWAWFVLVVGVDVSHVYSTLFRTYFDAESRRRYRLLLVGLPLLAFSGGVCLHLLGAGWFWRVMAYLAVFHFVRQQYGFMSIYSRNDERRPWQRQLDSAAVYVSALYPMVYWHCRGRDFHWFIEGDFYMLAAHGVERVAFAIWAAVLSGWMMREAYAGIREGKWNFPRMAVISGTALSWYTGIVLRNGDLAFTFTNVISHGIPYMALVWMMGRKKSRSDRTVMTSGRRFYRIAWIPAFLAVLFILAWTEEGLWDAWIWRDHSQWFPLFRSFSPLSDPLWLSFLVPLLAVPQVTHYLLDGFIWKLRSPDSEIRENLSRT